MSPINNMSMFEIIGEKEGSKSQHKENRCLMSSVNHRNAVFYHFVISQVDDRLYDKDPFIDSCYHCDRFKNVNIEPELSIDK